jgi:hypothetical protein
MPRGAQVIYPKDLGAILIAADIGPGQRVLEAGVGSGALSMTVLRAGASIVGYELREDFAERAKANVAATWVPTFSLPGRDPRRDRGHRRDRPRPDPARHARAPQGRRRVPPRPFARGASSWPICPPSTRPRCCVRRSTMTTCRSVSPRRRRSCGAPGTSRPARSVPTTAWSATPDSSPPRGGWTADSGRGCRRLHRGPLTTAATAVRPAPRHRSGRTPRRRGAAVLRDAGLPGRPAAPQHRGLEASTAGSWRGIPRFREGRGRSGSGLRMPRGSPTRNCGRCWAGR